MRKWFVVSDFSSSKQLEQLQQLQHLEQKAKLFISLVSSAGRESHL
jgi:hypothetical protein